MIDLSAWQDPGWTTDRSVRARMFADKIEFLLWVCRSSAQDLPTNDADQLVEV